ncbi:MAG TPA: hypothetical protein VFV10_10760 [Gammaproteobacteria bacterium]|nr:hypothetical protein [Gammaproteobacteria bacterium]
MNVDSINKVARARRSARLSMLGAAAFALAACSGGGDGSVGVGGGQDPDPVAVDFPIAYTKGPLFDDQMQLQSSTDLKRLLRFNVGTDLYVRDRASPSAPERNVTMSVTEGMGDVQGVEISPDGKKVLFAMRGPFDPDLDDEDQPTWNIWEYEIATGTLRRIISSDITAEAGQDISPHYLSDGRIIFASTRQRQSKAILLDEGKPQFDAQDEDGDEPAFVLHVMDADGENLHQVSFNQSHDFDPTVLDSGKVVFSRWDHAGGVDAVNLYSMNPDGTELELLYGAESHRTGTDGGEVEFVGAREMPDRRIMAILRPFDQPDLGGAITIIDTPEYVENTQPIAANAGLGGPAQVPATPSDVRTDDAPSPGGRFSSAFPLWDGTGRVLVSWAICRLVDATSKIVPCTDEMLADPAALAAPPLYGIWMYDPRDQTQLPIVIGEEGVLIGDVVAAQPRPNPQFIADKVPGVDLDQNLVAGNVGIIDIRSVYDVDGKDTAPSGIASLANPALATADQRPARFLRIVKAVSLPDDDVVDLDGTAFGPNRSQGMREIIGYAPLEPDGSVRVEVPANVALALDVVDRNGRRISARHQNWLQVRPGEEVKCNGCHAPQSGLSHGRSGSFDSVYAGASATGVAFPGTIQIGPAAIIPDAGETMAEARTRASCQTDSSCPALVPSVDLVYADVWTDSAVRTPDAPLEYRYSALTTAPPVSSSCMTAWTAKCRTVINYEQHIHPLWSVPRQTLAADGVTVLEDHTCSKGGCHAPVDAMGATAVPAAQLDLSDGLSPDQQAQFNAYRELLFADDQQELVNGALQDVVVQTGTDENGNPILEPVTVAAPMSAAGANASQRFFSEFDAGGTHEGWLTPAELRLVAEWLDIGAQYYNNPFDVPVN